MLEVLLKSVGDAEVVDALPFLAGAWSGEGSWAERRGPYLRRAVSRAPTALPAEIDQAVADARRYAPQVASLAPAARAAILPRASAAALAHREHLARLLALELGQPLKDSG